MASWPVDKKQDMLGSQVSAIRSQVQVIRYWCGCGKIQILNLYLNLKTWSWLPTAETRDLKMSAPANPPLSGSSLDLLFPRLLALVHGASGPQSLFCFSPANWPTVQLINFVF